MIRSCFNAWNEWFHPLGQPVSNDGTTFETHRLNTY